MRELSVLAAGEDHPNRPFLVTSDETLTYREVAQQARLAMAELTSRGVQPADRVAITPSVDVPSMVWLLAAFELGCPAVLLHPRLTPSERQRIENQTNPRVSVDASTPYSTERVTHRADAVPSERTLAVVYTSGTSGSARGAQLSRRAFVASFRAHTDNLGWAPGDRWLLAIPPAHVGGLSILTRSLIARRTVVLAEPSWTASTLAEHLRDYDVTLLSLVPTMLSRLLDADEWAPPPTLRAVLVGGAPLAKPLRRRAVERGLPILTTYGCTEACSQVSTQRLTEVGTEGSGAPLAGTRVRIVDGEVQVTGESLMDGYVGVESSESWTADGWFRTRDAGAFAPDGQLHVSGRLDDLIVTGGENVAPAEVEAVIATVPGVEAACVFAVPHHDWGQEVVAAIVASDPGSVGSGLVEALSSGLASFKRPKRVAWVQQIPLNRIGKVDRQRAAEVAGPLLRPI
ncbi:MAG: AMP-binding protein [Myxococcota bacterium]